METTLVLIKPDGVQRRFVGDIVGRFERKGLQIVGLKLMNVSRELASKHYAVHEGRPFYESLMEFVTSSPVVAIALRGSKAISVVRKMMGATFGSNAEPGTIRGDYGIDDGFNLVHGSDSPEAAEFELGLFFPDGTLDWSMADRVWVYEGEK